ncbi:hypothetical protein J4727_15020 [Providencia rettgeri]|uniref:Uncharacterized protein n=1 Tax=Providencia rettgeri TaxID=587 RepID=A0A939NHN1_PRORE|nr:hypothetical protein [Providencia rettgeri]
MYEWQFIDAVLFWYLIHDSSLFEQQEIAQWLPVGSTLKDILPLSIVQNPPRGGV